MVTDIIRYISSNVCERQWENIVWVVLTATCGKEKLIEGFGGWKRVYRHNKLASLVCNLFFLKKKCVRISAVWICVDKPTRCNTSYEWSLLFIIWLCMFRTITSPSSGASSHRLYNELVCTSTQQLDWWMYIHATARLVDVHPYNS